MELIEPPGSFLLKLLGCHQRPACWRLLKCECTSSQLASGHPSHRCNRLVAFRATRDGCRENGDHGLDAPLGRPCRRERRCHVLAFCLQTDALNANLHQIKAAASSSNERSPSPPFVDHVSVGRRPGKGPSAGERFPLAREGG